MNTCLSVQWLALIFTLMKVELFYDEGLAHASYMVVSGNEAAIVDPSRDGRQYYEKARELGVAIKWVLETHPHADFVSGHLSIAETTGAKIGISSEANAKFDHVPMNDGDQIRLGEVSFKALYTPGHTPDSMSFLLRDEYENPYAVFSGDCLFIGDVGRPDLLEGSGRAGTSREELARQQYRSLHNQIMTLPDEVLVYPAHGNGSLCGKALSTDRVSTIGRERSTNYAVQPMTEDEFVGVLLADQPFVPKYFGFNVGMNKAGAQNMEAAIAAIPYLPGDFAFPADTVVLDARPEKVYKAGHARGAMNLMDGTKFETWLGSVLGPNERFYLIVEDKNQGQRLMEKAAKIGYEDHVIGLLEGYSGPKVVSRLLDLDHFRKHPEAYTVVDTRTFSERKTGEVFEHSLHIELSSLRDRYNEVPTDKPIVVHCAGGYRSATGCSILRSNLPDAEIYDLSDAIKSFDGAASAPVSVFTN